MPRQLSAEDLVTMIALLSKRSDLTREISRSSSWSGCARRQLAARQLLLGQLIERSDGGRRRRT
jgi:hypothetical protein